MCTASHRRIGWNLKTKVKRKPCVSLLFENNNLIQPEGIKSSDTPWRSFNLQAPSSVEQFSFILPSDSWVSAYQYRANFWTWSVSRLNCVHREVIRRFVCLLLLVLCELIGAQKIQSCLKSKYFLFFAMPAHSVILHFHHFFSYFFHHLIVKWHSVCFCGFVEEVYTVRPILHRCIQLPSFWNFNTFFFIIILLAKDLLLLHSEHICNNWSSACVPTGDVDHSLQDAFVGVKFSAMPKSRNIDWDCLWHRIRRVSDQILADSPRLSCFGEQSRDVA